MTLRRLSIVLGLLLLAGVGAAAADLTGPGLTIVPDRIRIGFLYGGRKITVKTEAPAGSEVVIKVSCTGPGCLDTGLYL